MSAYLILTDEVQLNYYGQVSNGGAYPAINPKTIMEMELLIPHENMLIKFHSIVQSFLERMYQNEKEVKTLTTLRDSLLPKLMKGEIAV